MTAVACHHAADFGRAGERHAAEIWIPGQGGPGDFTDTGDDVDHAVRDADLPG